MTTSNVAVEENKEIRRLMPEDELIWALKYDPSFKIQKITVRAKSLWELVAAHLLWVPVIWAVIISPLTMLAFMLASWLFSSIKDHAFGYGLMATYGAGVYLSLKGKSKTLLKDFPSRKSLVGTKTLTLDFEKGQLVASEVFDHAPEKNREQAIEVRHIRPVTEWEIGLRQSDDDHLDLLKIKLRLDPMQYLQLPWARSQLSDPLFICECDSNVATEKAAAEARADEILVLLKRRFEAQDPPALRSSFTLTP